KGSHQVYENNPYRGYLSTMQSMAHFGLGRCRMIDSVVIRWPNGKKQTLKQLKADQLLKVNIADAREVYSWQLSKLADTSLFKEVTRKVGISYKHKYLDLIDFNIQTTL